MKILCATTKILHLNHLSHVLLFATLWTVAHQAPVTIEFSRQEFQSGLPCPPPGDRPNPCLISPVLAGRFFTASATWEALQVTLKGKGKLLSRVQLFATPWTAAHQAPPSMGLSRQEYWSGVPSSSPMNESTYL